MPNPEDGALLALFPPPIKIPSGPRPVPEPAEFPAPPAPSPSVPVPPPVLPVTEPLPEPVGEPPGLPGCAPSGEIEIRAERFPAGISGGGAAGPGVAESAIRVFAAPVEPVSISGAALEVSAWRCATRGADIGFTGKTGFGGALADEAILIVPSCFSGVSTCGMAASTVLTGTGALGRIAARCSAVNCSLGRAGWESAN